MGAGLLAKAVYQSTLILNDTPLSRASPLPQLDRVSSANQSSLMVIFGIAGVTASCNTIRAPT
ncbi:hypothetical protein ELQ88_28190 [Pseudomonas sp. MPC6]|nr:hypothetical protein ELQ88_28190 [Pseudomonas sp. MPC6]